MRPSTRILLVVACALAAGVAGADDPPEVEFQPVPCTVPEKPISLCSFVTDDVQVGVARVYFRPAGEKYFSFVDMTFGGINYCATLPGPREGKTQSLEYYVQAVDSEYQSRRTSTYQMAVQPEGVCGFPPLERDPERAAAITVHATNKKQGKNLPDEFVSTGVTFVPIER